MEARASSIALSPFWFITLLFRCVIPLSLQQQSRHQMGCGTSFPSHADEPLERVLRELLGNDQVTLDG